MSTREKMDPELKTRWVKALRSGRYKQGIGQLRDYKDERPVYCCLGVLCNILGHRGWDQDGGWRSPNKLDVQDVSVGKLSEQLRRKVQIPRLGESRLIRMNDIEKADFREIADWIEEKL